MSFSPPQVEGDAKGKGDSRLFVVRSLSMAPVFQPTVFAYSFRFRRIPGSCADDQSTNCSANCSLPLRLADRMCHVAL